MKRVLYVEEKKRRKAFYFQRGLSGNGFVILTIAEDWEECPTARCITHMHTQSLASGKCVRTWRQSGITRSAEGRDRCSRSVVPDSL